MATNNAVNISSAGIVNYNGTGTFTGINLTADGQLVIGSGAGAPTAATLTAGSNISITNGHNSITIATTGTTSQTTGTFSPTLVGGTVAGTTTYTTQQGYYINTGAEVVVFGTLDATPGGTASGDMHIGALPFTVKNQANGNVAGALSINRLVTGIPSSAADFTAQAQINTTFSIVFESVYSPGSGTNLAINGQETFISFSIIYQT